MAPGPGLPAAAPKQQTTTHKRASSGEGISSEMESKTRTDGQRRSDSDCQGTHQSAGTGGGGTTR